MTSTFAGEVAEALSGFLDALTDSVAVLDEHGTIVAVNEIWRDFALANGGPRASVHEGVNYLAVCDHAAGADAGFAVEAAEGIRAVADGRKAGFVLEYPCHSPTERRWFRLRASRFRAFGCLRILVAHENITARKLADEALRQSEMRFRRLAEVSFETVVVHDGDRVIEVNAMVQTMFGYEPHEAVGTPLAQFVPPEERDKMLANARSGTESAYESVGLRKDGSTFPMEVRSRIIEFDGRRRRVGVIRDLTDQKQAAAALRESEQQLREAQEIARLGRWELDVATGKIVWSDMVFEILGRERSLGPPTLDEMRGMLCPDERPLVDILLAQSGGIERRDFSYERRLRRSDGSFCWVQNHVRPYCDSAGRVLRLVGAVRDVTARKESEERLKLLAAEVDHRAKNLLAVVQVMLRQTRGATVAEYAKAAQGRIAALARAHTLLSRSHWRGADLGRLVADELAAFRRADGERIAIDGAPTLLRPEAAQAIAMAMHELATNATKYGGLSVPQGRIAVAWRRDGNGDLLLRWGETGGPAVSPPSRKGTGTNVIERSIGQQLNGSVRFDWQRTGLICEIHVPARELVGEMREYPKAVLAPG